MTMYRHKLHITVYFKTLDCMMTEGSKNTSIKFSRCSDRRTQPTPLCYKLWFETIEVRNVVAEKQVVNGGMPGVVREHTHWEITVSAPQVITCSGKKNEDHVKCHLLKNTGPFYYYRIQYFEYKFSVLGKGNNIENVLQEVL